MLAKRFVSADFVGVVNFTLFGGKNTGDYINIQDLMFVGGVNLNDYLSFVG